ncbi:uncharacterized protein LOC121635093 [Melanotaenia boesemani]|uniref:uncharacterized protein LOC121635093 n=1 Tax=Melanotaenia boesemani TaxID=1250792 RepID=UPI001C05E065|nr:uncharacterized protein LOC121635093 [Melanotaenia boesemani]
MNPTYTANITHKHQDVVLDFSPGPIRAEDGDRGIDSRLIYSILSGDDQNRFVINNRTGEIRLTRAVGDRRLAANFTLSIMVCQIDDRLKYSVASVLVRVLCENKFSPVFNRTTYKGFIIQSSSPASIVSTYGNQVLQVQVSDHDFSDGVNPNIRYYLHPPSRLYQVTQDGVLIARTDQLRAFDRHILQIMARDEESGEEVSASVDVEVLQRGQTGEDGHMTTTAIKSLPRGAFTEQHLFGDVDSQLASGIAVMILLIFLLAVLLVLLRVVRRRRLQEPDLGKHPNVVNSSPPVFMEESSYHSRAFKHQSSSGSGSFHGRQGVYTRKQSLPPPLSSSSSSSNKPADSRPRTFLPAPSDVSFSAGCCRFQTDLFVVVEKPEVEAHTWEAHRPPEVTGGDEVTVQPQRGNQSEEF